MDLHFGGRLETELKRNFHLLPPAGKLFETKINKKVPGKCQTVCWVKSCTWKLPDTRGVKKCVYIFFFFFSSCTFPTISIVRTNCGGVSSGHTHWKRSLKRSVQISGWLFHFPNYLFFPPKGDTCTKKEKTFFFFK